MPMALRPRPRPIYTTGGCGSSTGSTCGGSGYNNGGNGGSGYNGGCSSGTCGGFNYPGQQQQPQQAVNLPGQLGSWADDTPAVPEDAAEEISVDPVPV